MDVGTLIGFVCVIALLAASIFLAILDRKEKGKGNLEKARFLSKMALGLFLVAFVGGVVVTLSAGIRPREEGKTISGKMVRGGGMPGGMPTAAIGNVDEKEVAALEEKAANDPNDVKSRERLGHLYLQMQDFENVFRMAHEAIQVDPNSAESRAHMGMVLNAMGEAESAMNQFDQALAIDPKNTEALLFKGIVQFQGIGDLEGAKKTWDQFMKEAKPDDPGRARVTAFLQMIDAQLEKK
ncbi:MAG: tetratricopeptide repeat protein [Deltaproteobacteria bacterium]|nr:tetratricopeptide repeat protein [Deltaproteobacteria bacterium]